MHLHTVRACRNEFEKIALPRYEREIQAGNIRRSDVSPVGGGRAQTRQYLAAPAKVSPEALAQRRAMNEKLYHAQAAAPLAATGIRTSGVYKEPLKGGFAATQPSRWLGGAPAVYAPEQAGQFMRGIQGGGMGKFKTMMVAGAPEQLGEKFLPPPHAMDPTFKRAILQHELGEAAELGKPVVRPFASHMGPEPILRENLAMRGDPEAIGTMQKLRTSNPDDTLVQKAIRQAGGTPDAPLPLGGRQHRAVESYIDRNISKFDPSIRTNRLLQSTALGKEVPGTPTAIQEAAGRVGTGLDKVVMPTGAGKSFMSRLRAAKQVLPDYLAVRRFAKGK